MIHCSSFYFAVHFSAICEFRFGYNSYRFILFNHLIVMVHWDARFTTRLGCFFPGRGAKIYYDTRPTSPYLVAHAILILNLRYFLVKVACSPVFLRSTNLESKLIEFFVFVKF